MFNKIHQWITSVLFVWQSAVWKIRIHVKYLENIYDLPTTYGKRVFKITKETAVALKNIRKCAGITILQNNKSASDRRAFRYHMQAFPRFIDDKFHQNLMEGRVSVPEERTAYASNLKKYFADR